MQAKAITSLPKPDVASREHSARCAEFIRETIESAGGAIGFAEFMHHALYAPGLGYYVAGNSKFGESGDFVTAPEISPLFGRVLARQVVEVFEQVGSASVLEFGAGSGRLAADLLKALGELDALPESYQILEVSADLRERQSALLEKEVPELAGRVRFIDRLPDMHRGVIVANEVLDALPVERFAMRDCVMQQCVAVEHGAFVFVETPAKDALAGAVAAIERDLGHVLPGNYVSDVSLAAPDWVDAMLAPLVAGCAFLFDYGVSRREYYDPERSGGWLRCHFRHHAHNDPLILPGIQDISAWVDFTAVATAAAEAGADVAGYVNQSAFLLGGGLEQELAALASLPETRQVQLSAEVKTLTLPGEMGEHFKCLALCKGSVSRPSAFLAADRTHTL